MKKIVVASFIIITVISSFFILHAQKEDIYKRPHQFERSRDYDAKHYRINLTFDLDKKKFWGTNTITLTSLKDDFKECVLDAEDARWIFKRTPDMIDFFNNLYGYAYPWAKYDQVISPRMGGGAEKSRKVKLEVCQVQDTSRGVPVYKLPVIIGIHTEMGKTAEKVWIEKQETVFEFAVGEKPLLVRFDEGNYLLKEWTFSKSLEELLYQLENDDVIGRGWAAAELSEYAHDSRALAGLVKSARSDEFWAVRQNAVIFYSCFLISSTR